MATSVRIRFPLPRDSNAVVGKLEVRARQLHLWHVTAHAPLACHRTRFASGGKNRPFASCCDIFLPRCLFHTARCMARLALGIVSGVPLFQILVGIVASSTSKTRVLRVVAAAVEQAIRLKTHVVDATEAGHHCHGVHAAMASPAELLRKTFGIECFWIENVHALSRAEEHYCGMAPSRSVARLAGYAGNQSIQLKLGVDHRCGAMATKTIPRFIATDVAPCGLL